MRHAPSGPVWPGVSFSYAGGPISRARVTWPGVRADKYCTITVIGYTNFIPEELWS